MCFVNVIHLSWTYAESFFNADSHAKLDDSNQKLGGIQDHPQQPIEVEKILYTNPAALARSFAFQEGK